MQKYIQKPISTLNKVEAIILSLYHLKTVNEEVNIENEKNLICTWTILPICFFLLKKMLPLFILKWNLEN